MHSIVYRNAPSHWNEALPLGNGVLGAMACFHDGQYELALNHYEVYYTSYARYSHRAQQETVPVVPGRDRARYEALVEAARKNTGDYSREAFLNYRRTIWPEADVPRQAGLQSGQSQPPTGEVRLLTGEALREPDESCLRLDIEDAAVRLRLKKGDAALSAETVVLGADGVLTRVSQSSPGLAASLTLSYPQRRNHEGYQVQWEQLSPSLFLCSVSFYSGGEDREQYPPFSFRVVHRLLGAGGEGELCGSGLRVRLTEAGRDFSLLSCVLTELAAPEQLQEAALALSEQIAEGLPVLLAEHKKHWQDFFARSRVQLPDPVLERLWYLNLYVLGCCSGRGGRRKEQASGLNGLWDIRQPTKWGSLWYWDVNIEASYWPVYTANHLELAEAFNDGFLSYLPMAERRARELYGMRGYAMDYPHDFYNCMWPWCAQYLWWYYEYSGDTAFLRDRAYPVFYNLALFVEDVMQYDPDRDCWDFFPDVSPEQGPITRNSVITVSTVRYLLKTALEAASVLNAPAEHTALYRRLLDRLPAYPTARMDRYGEVLRDSELAPAGIRLRHPSLLMPIYPLSELNPESGEEAFQLARNTVLFASENTELGVFSFGWISAAAARLGMGSTALRVLYEQGLDLILRNNGMGTEETERWVNFCLVRACRTYQPFMMECVGEIVNCVNEMLLQSYDGVIRVFPAVPDGDPETFRGVGQQAPDPNPWGQTPPVCWQDCGFESLLAKGGFEVSARMEKRETRWIQVRSLRGGTIRIQLPASLQHRKVFCGDQPVESRTEGTVLCFETVPGGVYTLGEHPSEQADLQQEILCYTTHLGRRQFIGRDQNTDAFKAMDSFLCDYYLGNDRVRCCPVYCFSFGLPFEQLRQDVPADSLPQCPSDLQFLRITPSERWSSCLGFGWAADSGLSAVDDLQGPYLLRDGIQGTAPADFLVELPAGRYDLLALTGSTEENSSVRLSVNGFGAELLARKGQYKAEVLPVIHRSEEPIRLSLSALDGQWRVNALIIRKIQAYL